MLKIKIIDQVQRRDFMGHRDSTANSDILHRHILPKLQHHSYLIDFEFNERESIGTIVFQATETLRTFLTHSYSISHMVGLQKETPRLVRDRYKKSKMSPPIWL